MRLPSHAEMFPNLYMNPVVFNRAREEAEVIEAGSRVSILDARTLRLVVPRWCAPGGGWRVFET